MKGRIILISAVALGLLLVLVVGLSQAQGPEPPEGGVDVQGEAGASAITPGAIPIQGRLTDNNGNPLPDGNYDVTFRLYESETGGTAICTDTNTVAVENGLFSSYLDGCYDLLHGQKVWLSVEVGSDGEMTPRQPIYAVPYALSLRPGAIISYPYDHVLTVQSTGSGDSDALIAEASGTGEAIEAYATGGVGIFAQSDSFLALQAYSYEDTDYPAVYGCSAPQSSSCDSRRGEAAAGVLGYGSPGVFGIGYGLGDHGVLGRASIFAAGVKGEGNILAYGGWFTSSNIVLYITSPSEGSIDAIQVAGGKNGDVDFRVTNDGAAYADGGWNGTADFAEMIEAADEGYEPGDVLVISTDKDRTVELSTEPYSTLVAGVYSADPGFIGSDHPMDGPEANEVPMAVVGIVSCKVSAENGPIHRGDLLVTSSTPGHAMRAGPNPPQGTVLGKALGELEEGTGVILILVTLQ